ncbi:hypothetical protein [Streptomyces siamensis]|uniref:Uncharacterized protein n=1 Tax=Streptomyces siamensis TaxID=1274986 RepID=A0ABP9JDI3_9ACTN
MGIDLELHSARPARNNWRKSRATLLRSYGHGDALADALGSLQLLGVSGRLTAVDPYGNTLMNEQEAAAALREIDDLMQRCDNERQLAALNDLALMLQQCAATRGSYLWFAGD